MNRKLKVEEMDRLSVEAFKKASKIPLVVVLDNIRSLNNIGSVFRSSDAFRVEKVWLCGITATPPHRGIRKTALGASESVEWEYRENTLDLIEELKEKGYQTLAVEQTKDSHNLLSFEPQADQAYVLVLGNEVKGVDQDVVNACDGVLEIPQEGTKHSLNISVSAGIVLWHFYQAHKKTL
ncbi:RNA methyltransferase [bacterium SCSIO 12741]|nr:RNA methyltransferase [bacterium SCSIO 12741]